MRRLYGDRLRKDGGLTKTFKSVAGRTFETKVGKHAPELKRVVREVRGSIEKVEERVTEAVEDFLDHGERNPSKSHNTQRRSYSSTNFLGDGKRHEAAPTAVERADAHHVCPCLTRVARLIYASAVSQPICQRTIPHGTP